MHFGFNNQFIKVKRTLAKISKTIKILFCLILISGIMNLYVNHIPDIKRYIFFLRLRIVSFLLDKDKDLFTEEDFS